MSISNGMKKNSVIYIYVSLMMALNERCSSA